jgi:hypothetical protein
VFRQKKIKKIIHWLKKGKSTNHQIKSTQASLQAKHKPSTITLKFFTSSIIKVKVKNNLTSFKSKRSNRISASNKKSKFKKFKKNQNSERIKKNTKLKNQKQIKK